LTEILARRLRRLSSWIERNWTNTDEDSEQQTLDDKIHFLAERLVPCWHLRYGADKSASIAQQRVNLWAFKKRGDFSMEALDSLDAATQAAIVSRCRGGWVALMTNYQADRVERAVDIAIRSRGKAAPGRPKLSDSLCRRQLALFLASAYATATGKLPGRSFRSEAPRKSRNATDFGRIGEGGRFHEFCRQFVEIMPRRFLPIRRGAKSRIDKLVQLAVREHRVATEDARRRKIGSPDHRLWNIRDQYWLGPARGIKGHTI
jgi:hypothetical protein